MCLQMRHVFLHRSGFLSVLFAFESGAPRLAKHIFDFDGALLTAGPDPTRRALVVPLTPFGTSGYVSHRKWQLSGLFCLTMSDRNGVVNGQSAFGLVPTIPAVNCQSSLRIAGNRHAPDDSSQSRPYVHEPFASDLPAFTKSTQDN